MRMRAVVALDPVATAPGSDTEYFLAGLNTEKLPQGFQIITKC
jgi:hypothetical protein